MSEQRQWIFGRVWLRGDDLAGPGRLVTVTEVETGHVTVEAEGPPLSDASLSFTARGADALPEAVGRRVAMWMQRPGLQRLETLEAQKLRDLGDSARLILSAFALSSGRDLESLTLRFVPSENGWQIRAALGDAVLLRLPALGPLGRMAEILRQRKVEVAARLGAMEELLGLLDAAAGREG